VSLWKNSASAVVLSLVAVVVFQALGVPDGVIQGLGIGLMAIVLVGGIFGDTNS
jgi:hypothetical protein